MPRIPRDFEADAEEKLTKLLRASGVCRGRRERNAGTDCIADVPACRRQALTARIEITQNFRSDFSR